MKILGVIFFDVVLPICGSYLEIHNLFEYANVGQWTYVITMCAILIVPGTLGRKENDIQSLQLPYLRTPPYDL